jgi:hypothetical protein
VLGHTVGGGTNGAYSGSKWYTRLVGLRQLIKPRWPGTLWSYLQAHLLWEWGLFQEENSLALCGFGGILFELRRTLLPVSLRR